jgi:DNA primase
VEGICMGKISPVSAKYIIHAHIRIEGVVDRPDVIGSVFGQTEGLLGNDLELRELQRSGRIGRIEVDYETKGGKTEGVITLPTSTDKTETVLIAAALETIERIGPCNAHVVVQKVEDVRTSKRNLVVTRAKELLSQLTHTVLPDSRDIKQQVNEGARILDVVSYGRDRLPAGPGVEHGDDIIVVEGRADVLNLLKCDINNAVAMNGTSVPQTIIDLSKKKVVTVFVDGDRGGDLIIRELGQVADIDYVVKAPDGKEVEEITTKEIHKALRGRVSYEQMKHDIERSPSRRVERAPVRRVESAERPRRTLRRTVMLQKQDSENFKKMLDDLIGTHGAYILDEGSNILGKVPMSELPNTLTNLQSGVHAIILDGDVTKDIVSVAERARVKYVVAHKSEISHALGVQIVTNQDLQMA